MKKTLLTILLILCLFLLVGCEETPVNGGENPPEEGTKLLSFSQAQSVEEMKK